MYNSLEHLQSQPTLDEPNVGTKNLLIMSFIIRTSPSRSGTEYGHTRHNRNIRNWEQKSHMRHSTFKSNVSYMEI
jgi:hypothetical protein